MLETRGMFINILCLCKLQITNNNNDEVSDTQLPVNCFFLFKKDDLDNSSQKKLRDFHFKIYLCPIILRLESLVKYL